MTYNVFGGTLNLALSALTDCFIALWIMALLSNLPIYWHLLQELSEVLHKGAEGAATDSQWFQARFRCRHWRVINANSAWGRSEV